MIKGSPRPKPASLERPRLYSSNQCLFSQRVQIILKVKDIPFEIVEIDLKNKPEWYNDVNPHGKIPALDVGDQIVVESALIADFLDEKYPIPQLYSADLEKKNREKQLITLFDKVIYSTLPAYKSSKGLPEYEEHVKNFFVELSSELKRRGTKYLNGDLPGMVEYVLWPWIVRIKVPFLVHEVEFDFPKSDSYLTLKTWKDVLTEDRVLKDMMVNVEEAVKSVREKFLEKK